MKKKWYYQVMGEEIGPLTDAQLHRYAIDGDISPDSLVKNSDDTEWVAADSIDGLFDPESCFATEFEPISNLSNHDDNADDNKSVQSSEVQDRKEFVEAIRNSRSNEKLKKFPLPTTLIFCGVISAVVFALIQQFPKSKVSKTELNLSNLPDTNDIDADMKMSNLSQPSEEEKFNRFANAFVKEARGFTNRVRFEVGPTSEERVDYELKKYRNSVEGRFEIVARPITGVAHYEIGFDSTSEYLGSGRGSITVHRKLVYDQMQGQFFEAKGWSNPYHRVILTCEYVGDRWEIENGWKKTLTSPTP